MPPLDSHTFPRSHRLRTKGEFSRVFDARVRESRGPVTVYSVRNDLPHPRLGLSLSRKVGTAVRRNRIKRLLREAFRLRQHELPPGFDLVVVVRPHEPLPLADYQASLIDLAARLERAWSRRT